MGAFNKSQPRQVPFEKNKRPVLLSGLMDWGHKTNLLLQQSSPKVRRNINCLINACGKEN